MGHSSIGQTADTYGHVQPEQAAMASLDRYPEALTDDRLGRSRRDKTRPGATSAEPRLSKYLIS